MSQTAQKILSVLALFVGAAYGHPAARPYVESFFVALGAFATLATVLASMPGKVGEFGRRMGQDVSAVQALAPKPKGPPTIPPVLGVMMLATGLAGCGALPPVARIVVEAGCVATHYDELAEAEQEGRAQFLAAIARVARECGIEREAVVTIFGTHKQGRARAAAAPACSSTPLATPVRP